MKILFCGKCFSMHSFPDRKLGQGENDWVACDCKQMSARWLDENAGTVEVLARMPELALIVGMNNNFIRAAVLAEGGLPNDDWQKNHRLATVAPGYVFDAHSRACWAAILRVGETNDVKWHPMQEKVKAGASVEEALFKPTRIIVNGKPIMAEMYWIGYKDVLQFCGHNPETEVLYSITYRAPSKSGIMGPKDAIQAEIGLIMNCVFTGGA